jgi:periplasmic protein TonB
MNSPNRSLPARRSPMGLVLVVGLHALFVYALITGLGLNRSLTLEPPPLDLLAPPEHKVTYEPPPARLDPTLVPPVPVDFPLPPLIIEDAPDLVDDTAPAQTVPQGSGTADLSAWIAARVDPRHPLSQPPYPPSAIRNNQEGTLTLALLVRPDGRVAQATVARSSGIPVLDEAAVLEAKRRWKLLPAMRGSAAVEGWTNLKVVFRLDQR